MNAATRQHSRSDRDHLMDGALGFIVTMVFACLVVTISLATTTALFLLGYSSTDERNNGSAQRINGLYPYLYSPLRGTSRKYPPGWWIPIALVAIALFYNWNWVGVTGLLLGTGMLANHLKHADSPRYA